MEKDLIVDMEPFFQSFREVMPFLINKGHEPTKERLQSAEDRERFDDTTKCILCAACTSSCPVFWTDGQYFGPAAIVNAHRFIFDSRDDAGDMRLEILNDKEGVWRCRTTFNCSEACPRGIQVTQAIAEVKQAALRAAVPDPAGTGNHARAGGSPSRIRLLAFGVSACSPVTPPAESVNVRAGP